MKTMTISTSLNNLHSQVVGTDDDLVLSWGCGANNRLGNGSAGNRALPRPVFGSLYRLADLACRNQQTILIAERVCVYFFTCTQSFISNLFLDFFSFYSFQTCNKWSTISDWCLESGGVLCCIFIAFCLCFVCHLTICYVLCPSFLPALASQFFSTAVPLSLSYFASLSPYCRLCRRIIWRGLSSLPSPVCYLSSLFF